ncbi:YeiH family protein [Gorillibacterium sp. sgz500922]|uniref:YeiH family protein n=1 Tax=Gorillibacterium sp. sgz500922 TaxID=3446694 RepID=UPI003F669155
MNNTIGKIPGLALAALIAVPAWIIGSRYPVAGSPVIGLLLGLLLAYWKRPPAFESGTAFASKKLLQYAIVLQGFAMNLSTVIRTGSETLLLMAFTLTATFASAYGLGRLLKLETDTNILIGVGTAICGGSAIAAAAPVIGAKEEEVARAISTIFLFNVISAFAFPALGHLLNMNDRSFGLWAGTAVNDTSSVVAAGYAYSAAAGKLAVIVKLTRTLAIIPVTLILALHTSRKRSKAAGERYSLVRIFPWFVIGVLAASMINTFLPLPEGVGPALAQAGKFAIVMAMAAIGLNTRLGSLVRGGWRPILLGLGSSVALSATSLLVQYTLMN